ncbi:Gfo/Idh/MocA family oxidoreductase [soil metagenome]
MADRFRVAIVGLGIGGAHADGFRRLPDHFQVVAVADLDPARVEMISGWLECDGLTTLDEVCARDDVDIVSVATPPFLHFDQIGRTLAAGKHVIAEKPLVGSVAEVDELARLEQQSGRRVMPVMQYRFGRGLQRLRLLVDEGVAGRVNVSSVDLAWRRRPEYYDVPWRGAAATELGGVLLSHAIHLIDMLTYVVGPVRRVFARTTTRVNRIETEDCASVSFEMADGSLATLSATLGSPAETTRHRFSFEHLSAESNAAAYENHRDPWNFTGDSPDVDERIAATLDRFDPRPELYKGQFLRFHEAITTGHELPVTLADARAVLEVVTAAYMSAATGSDVDVAVGPDHPAYHGWGTAGP